MYIPKYAAEAVGGARMCWLPSMTARPRQPLTIAAIITIPNIVALTLANIWAWSEPGFIICGTVADYSSCNGC